MALNLPINTIKQTIMKKNIFKTLAVTVLSAVSLTAWAVDPYAGLVNTTTAVHFNDYDWYIIEDNSTAVDAGTVTLLAADTRFGTSKFHDSSNAYSGSTVKSYLDALTAEGGSFYGVKDAIEDTDLTDVGVTGAKLYLLSTSEAGPYVNFNFTGAQYGGWWLRSPDMLYDDGGVIVYGELGFVFDHIAVSDPYGVRPALKLNLSKVSFDTETKTFSVAPTTSVATPTLSPADAAKSNIWYDLNGRHYQGKPTMQGVYINNRQKYVVK